MPLVEKRYAEALIHVSVERNAIDSYQEDLGSVADIYNRQADFKNFLLNPETDISAKKETMRKIFDGRIKDDVLHFLMLLLDKGRIRYLPGIYTEFVRLADKERSILNMNIITASPLDDGQLNAIKEKFRTLYHASSVKAEVQVDTSLIGGVKVVIGDKLIDGTVKGRLKNLEELLVNG